MIRWRMGLTMMLALLSVGCGNSERHIAPAQTTRDLPEQRLPEVPDMPSGKTDAVTLDETPPPPVARPRPAAPAQATPVAPAHIGAVQSGAPAAEDVGPAKKAALAKGTASHVSASTSGAPTTPPRSESPEAAGAAPPVKLPPPGGEQGQGKKAETSSSVPPFPRSAKPPSPALAAADALQEGGPEPAAVSATSVQPAAPGDSAALASALPEPPASPAKSRFEEDSLDCDVIELMGRAIGQRRLAGEDGKPAIDGAIDDVLRQTGGVRDKRFVFSGRVYGMLIYQLTADHSEAGFGAYAHSACLILRGGKGIVPADDVSKKQLDESLANCEAASEDAETLNACIATRMEEIVRQRGF